ncbi:MAG: UpxY family transcription antiterminator, partial [Bacteroidales bacterium]|nr:UpxY family transcription antiterminator [Bacteroidales bacterium]
MSQDTDLHWVTFNTKPRAEKKVNELLIRNGFEPYLPLQRSLHKWHDRKKWVETPLFNSYIFVHIR